MHVHNTSPNRITGCTPVYLDMGNPRETMVEVTHLPELMSEQPIKDLALERVRFYYALSKEARANDLKYHNEAIRRQQRIMDTLTQAEETLTVGTRVLVYLPWVSKGLTKQQIG